MEFKVNRICKTCQKTFKVYKSSLEKSNASGNFCSRKCYNIHLTTLKGEKNKLYNRIDSKCDFCKKEIKIIPAKFKAYKKHFCSNECRYNFHIGRYAQEKNPFWKGGHIKSRGNFNTIKSLFFKKKQFCAICGTFKSIHIHHIIPYRCTKDNSKSNLIPLCRKHHRIIEVLTWDIVKTKSKFEDVSFILGGILRDRQIQTFYVLKELEAEINGIN